MLGVKNHDAWLIGRSCQMSSLFYEWTWRKVIFEKVRAVRVHNHLPVSRGVAETIFRLIGQRSQYCLISAKCLCHIGIIARLTSYLATTIGIITDIWHRRISSILCYLYGHPFPSQGRQQNTRAALVCQMCIRYRAHKYICLPADQNRKGTGHYHRLFPR